MVLLLTACLVNWDLYYQRRAELLDQDSDGHISADYPEEGGDDCDDHDPGVHPGQDATPYDGIDNDCDPETADDDLDGDGAAIATDCDDDDPDIHPGADDPCDGVDNDCDGVDACLPTGLVDVADAPLTLTLDDKEETATGGNLVFLDFDGDGLDDLLVSSPLAEDLAGRVDLVTGLDALAPGSHELGEVATLTVSGGGGPGLLGVSLARGCDVDGDGFDDALVSANGDGDGMVYGYEGGPLGVRGAVGLDAATWTLSSTPGAGGYFGTDLACGRLDSDVAADLVVGEFLHSRVWIFSGMHGDQVEDRGPEDADLVVELGDIQGSVFGAAVAVLGDLDGDGLEEVGLSSRSCIAGYGCVWIDNDLGTFIGTGQTEVLTTDDLTAVIQGGDPVGLGTTIRAAGDVDGDGLADLLLSSRDDDLGSYGAWLFTALGAPDTWSRTTDDATAWWTLAYAGEQLATECDAGRDVDGDGHADILIGEQGADLGTALGGAALLYLGGADLEGGFTDADAWALLASSVSGGRAGAAVALAGDATGEGLGDIAVGVPSLGSPGGSVALWWGGPRLGD